MPISWPSDGEYAEAIQNPHICFIDPDLQGGGVRTKRFGVLPVGATGRYAIVFDFECGGKIYALKCFTSSSATDLQSRYSVLSDYLKHVQLSFLAAFAFLPESIIVGREKFPLVRMQWVPDKQLGRYLDHTIGQGGRINGLATEFRHIIEQLNHQQIAHGDLQHGNILVSDHGRITLIDYDGMFVPDLAQDPPSEDGHPNYQHPERLLQGYYYATTDNFSSIVIYLALMALQGEPQLWHDFNDSESILFKKEDFENPGQTVLWKRLQQHGDQEIRRLTEELQDYCATPLSGVPALEEALGRISGIPVNIPLPFNTSSPTPVPHKIPSASGQGVTSLTTATPANLSVASPALPPTVGVPSGAPILAAQPATPTPPHVLRPHIPWLEKKASRLLFWQMTGLALLALVIVLGVLVLLSNVLRETEGLGKHSSAQPQLKRISP